MSESAQNDLVLRLPQTLSLGDVVTGLLTALASSSQQHDNKMETLQREMDVLKKECLYLTKKLNETETKKCLHEEALQEKIIEIDELKEQLQTQKRLMIPVASTTTTLKVLEGSACMTPQTEEAQLIHKMEPPHGSSIGPIEPPHEGSIEKEDQHAAQIIQTKKDSVSESSSHVTTSNTNRIHISGQKTVFRKFEDEDDCGVPFEDDDDQEFNPMSGLRPNNQQDLSLTVVAPIITTTDLSVSAGGHFDLATPITPQLQLPPQPRNVQSLEIVLVSLFLCSQTDLDCREYNPRLTLAGQLGPKIRDFVRILLDPLHGSRGQSPPDPCNGTSETISNQPSKTIKHKIRDLQATKSFFAEQFNATTYISAVETAVCNRSLDDLTLDEIMTNFIGSSFRQNLDVPKNSLLSRKIIPFIMLRHTGGHPTMYRAIKNGDIVTAVNIVKGCWKSSCLMNLAATSQQKMEILLGLLTFFFFILFFLFLMLVEKKTESTFDLRLMLMNPVFYLVQLRITHNLFKYNTGRGPSDIPKDIFVTLRAMYTDILKLFYLSNDTEGRFFFSFVFFLKKN